MKIETYEAINLLVNKFRLKEYEQSKIDRILNRELLKSKVLKKIYSMQLKFRKNIKHEDMSYEFSMLDSYDLNKKIISNPKIFRKVDGVKFISDNEDSITKMVDFYEVSKRRVKKDENGKSIFDNIGKINCIITDLKVANFYSSCCFYDKDVPPLIYLEEDDIKSSNVNTIYHEVGHFYDMFRNMLKIEDVIKKTKFDKEKATIFLRRIHASLLDTYQLVKKEITSSDSMMGMINKDVEGKFSENSFFIRDKMVDTKVNNLAIDIVDSVYAKDGIDALCDIIEAVSLKKHIKLKADFPYFHGKKYYKNRLSTSSEIFANFTNLCSIGKEDILDEVFPKEFKEQLRTIYMDTVFFNDKGNSMSNGRDNVK